MDVSVGVIKFPRGKGQPRKQLLGTTKDQIKAKNRSIEYIENEDDLCLARSLVVARAYERFREKNMTNKSWRWMKDVTNPKQRKAAEDIWPAPPSPSPVLYVLCSFVLFLFVVMFNGLWVMLLTIL